MNKIPFLPKDLLNLKAVHRKHNTVNNRFYTWVGITDNFKLSIKLSIVKQRIKEEKAFDKMTPGEICYDFKKARQKMQRSEKRKILKNQADWLVARKQAQWKVSDTRKRSKEAMQIQEEQQVLSMTEFEEMIHANSDKDPALDEFYEEAQKRIQIFQQKRPNSNLPALSTDIAQSAQIQIKMHESSDEQLYDHALNAKGDDRSKILKTINNQVANKAQLFSFWLKIIERDGISDKPVAYEMFRSLEFVQFKEDLGTIQQYRSKRAINTLRMSIRKLNLEPCCGIYIFYYHFFFAEFGELIRYYRKCENNGDLLYEAFLLIGIKPSMASRISSNPDLYTEPAFLKFLVEMAPKTASRIVKIFNKFERPLKFNETIVMFTKLLRYNDSLFEFIKNLDFNALGVIDINDLYEAARFIHYRYGVQWHKVLSTNHPSKWRERLEEQKQLDYINKPDLEWDEKFKQFVKERHIGKEFKKVENLSRDLYRKESSNYIHSVEFSLICAAVKKLNQRINWVQVPRASGKTFLVYLLQVIFPEKSAIVFPTRHLLFQFQNLVQTTRSIPLLTMEEALVRIDDFDQFILDDADECILNHGTYLDDSDSSSPLRSWHHLLELKKTYLVTSCNDKEFFKTLNSLEYLPTSKLYDYRNLFRKTNEPGIRFASYDKVDTQIKDMVKAIGQYLDSCLVICRSKSILKKLSNHPDLRNKSGFHVMICDSDNDFRVDANKKIPQNTVFLCLEEYARGQHIMLKRFARQYIVMLDHLPDSYDLISHYAGICSKRTQEVTCELYIWKNKRKHEVIDNILSNKFRMEMKDGARLIEILRGREKLGIPKNHQFDQYFKNSWRFYVRSLQKEFKIADIKHWEQVGSKSFILGERVQEDQNVPSREDLGNSTKPDEQLLTTEDNEDETMDDDGNSSAKDPDYK